jgi:hypothetical protein
MRTTSDTPTVEPASAPRRRRHPVSRGRVRRSRSPVLALVGGLAALLLVGAAAVTSPAVAAAPAARCT